jgi:ribosomal protein S18 acetylase RimI-like enzyme
MPIALGHLSTGAWPDLKAGEPPDEVGSREMDDARLAALAYDNLYPFYEVIAGGTGSSRIERLDGVVASVVPAVPERSIMNGVIYEDAARLAAALPELGRLYDAAGVNAWTVWVRTGDREAAAALDEAGHVLDASPAGMAMPLEDWQPPAGRGSRIGEAALADVTRVNDAAYGWDGEFSRGLEQAPPELRLYGADVDGQPAAVAAWLPAGDDCAVYMVGALPAARGRGLATDLMIQMLSDAKAEGCATTSLQATKAGYPIYRRLGYRDLGPLEMWERRQSSG